MFASDVMTAGVITVLPDDLVIDVAKLLLEQRISAVPVVDGGGQLVGIVSEGDLIHRHESETERADHWWQFFTETTADIARAYARAHGRRARDVMTRDVVAVEASTPLAEVATLFDKHRIKRVPVVEGGRVAGIVSRSNFLQALLVASQLEKSDRIDRRDDHDVRDAILREISASHLSNSEINVVASKGVAGLWGLVETEDQRRALVIAAENTPGVREVEDHLGVLPRLGLMEI